MILLSMIMMMTVLPRCVELGWQGLMTKEVLLLWKADCNWLKRSKWTGGWIQTSLLQCAVQCRVTVCAVDTKKNLTNVQVELFGSGQFIPDDSYPSTYKGANERKCVTDLKTNTEKFVSSTTPVSSYQEHLDQSRLSSAKADTLEAFLFAIKDDASIDSYYSYCDAVSRRECHDVADTVCADVQEIVYRQKCTSPSSGSFPKFLTNLLQYQGILAGISLNPERSRDPIDVVKIRIVSQASSATISSNLNERKCSDQQVPRTTYTIPSRGGSARTWPTPCALTPMLGPVQDIKLQRQCKVQYKRQCQTVQSLNSSQETWCNLKQFICDIQLFITQSALLELSSFSMLLMLCILCQNVKASALCVLWGVCLNICHVLPQLFFVLAVQSVTWHRTAHLWNLFLF